MANINGTNLAAPIVPFTTDDTYPTHYAKYGKGGHRTVATITERDGIFTALREEGMEVYVLETGKKYTLVGGLLNTNWVESTSITPGANTQIIFNDGGTTLIGDVNLTYNKLSKTFLGGKTIRNVGTSFFLDDAGNITTTGNFNLGAGFNALKSVTSGDNNIAVGGEALNLVTTGFGNTALGYATLKNGNGSLNFGLGYEAGRDCTGINNIFLGSYAGNTETSISNRLIVETDQTRNSNKDYLIEGDFSQRWVKFNGAVMKRINNITAPAAALTTGTVTSYLNGVITDTSKTFVVNAYSDKLIIITGGLGFGNVSKIASNTSNTITCISFGDGLLDSTSTYKIVDATWISNEKFNSEYLIDLSTEDYFIYFNNIPNYSQEINITINKNPNNKNLWVAAETTNGLILLPYNTRYKSYNTPLITHTFKAYKQDVFSKGYLETSNDLNNLLQPIKTSTKDLVIDLYSKIYKIDVANATTVTFNIDSSYIPILTGNSLTIELDINMTVVSNITWPINVTWIGGSAPTFGSIAKYRLVFRTEDAGTTWLGNLAYTY